MILPILGIFICLVFIGINIMLSMARERGVMSSFLLRPICWVERHHWLLTKTKILTVYEGNLLPRDEEYHYQCQRCGAWSTAKIINLDNQPTPIKSKRTKS